MRKTKTTRVKQSDPKQRVPIGFCCDECKRWFLRTELVSVNEVWNC
jgi:hypothetical protein